MTRMKTLTKNPEFTHWVRFIVAALGLWGMLSRIPTHAQLREELKPIQDRVNVLNLRVDRIEEKVYNSNR